MKYFRNLTWFLFAAVVFASTFRGVCAESGGTSALPILNVDIGARPLGMGGAYTALSDDMFGVHYNPAGLGYVKNFEISAASHNGVLDTTIQYVGIAIPIPAKTFSGEYTSALGISFLTSSNGDIDWYKLASDGSASVSGASRDAGSDNIFALTYGDTIYSDAYDAFSGFFTIRHFVGATVKFITSTLPNSDGSDVSAGVWAADIGYLVEAPEANSRFGISLNNLGGKVKYIEEKDPLPRTLRAGAAYTHKGIFTGGFTLSFDVVHYMEDDINRLHTGVELALLPILKFRGGYRFLGDAEGFSAGAGGNIFGLTVDFAMFFDELIDNVYQISATYRFGRRPERGKPTQVKIRDKYRTEKEKKKTRKKRIEETPAYETQREEEALLILD